MAAPHRQLLPDGIPVYSGYESPYDENGVDLTLVDAMLGLTPGERLAWLEEVAALGAPFRKGLEPWPDGQSEGP